MLPPGSRVFVYEFVTAGGTWHDPTLQPSGSLLNEGRVMVDAVGTDLRRAGLTVETLWDTRLSMSRCRFASHPVDSAAAHDRQFDACCRSCDAVLLIAPEFDDLLLQRCRRAEQLGAHVVSPDAGFVALASDKCRTLSRLAAAGVPVPETYADRSHWESNRDGAGLWVLKPVDGAGSLNLRCGTIRQLESWWAPHSEMKTKMKMFAQPFCPGRPASVAALCGPQGYLLLPPCWQTLDEAFVYRGGVRMQRASTQDRAAALATATLEALPATRGFVGIDLVLGEDEGGTDDVVMEVNPRLTSSFQLLSLACETNLAAAMLTQVCGGRPKLSFAAQPVEFRVVP